MKILPRPVSLRLPVTGLLLSASLLLQAQQPTFDWVTRLISRFDSPWGDLAAAPDGNSFILYGRSCCQSWKLAKLNQQGAVILSQTVAEGGGGSFSGID